jgi:hypothetical protein
LVRVRTSPTCGWNARSSAAWVRISLPGLGTGNGEIGYSVEENFSTSDRSATITVGSEVHRITQERAREVRLEGKISGLSGSCPNLRFMVDGTAVTTNGETEFRDGRCSGARDGEEVTVRGLRHSDGTVHARRVEFDD